MKRLLLMTPQVSSLAMRPASGGKRAEGLGQPALPAVPALVTLLLLLVPGGVAAGFDPNRRTEPGDVRIAILQPHPSPAAEETMVQTKVVRHLVGELKSRGFDAYETSWTFDDAMRAESVDVDYYVEISRTGAASADVAGIGIGGRRADVSIGVVVSHVVAELRVYDAQTMELVASEDLRKRSAAIMPTSIGFGGDDLFAWIALPFVHRAQYRSAAKAAAREAASIVAEAVR